MSAVAYLSGVLHGDGWCTAHAFGLRVADEDFARAFSAALTEVYGLGIAPKRDERGYWLTRTSNKTGRFTPLLTFEPSTDEERAAWVRGLFDSEGNAQLWPLPIMSANSYGRRVAIYSTNRDTLDRATHYLTALGVSTALSEQRHSNGHKGTRPVYELRVRGSRSNYARFADLVSSNIARKRDTLDRIPASYRADTGYCREGQRKGATTRHARTMNETLPRVVEGVRELLRNGIKPTQRACRCIPGYDSVQRHIRQADLIALAHQKE